VPEGIVFSFADMSAKSQIFSNPAVLLNFDSIL